MAEQPPPSIARMRKRHSPSNTTAATAADGHRLIAQQSVRDALVAGLVVVVLFSVLWAMLSTLLNKIYPWMTIVLGIFVGLAIRRAGRGIDWRFPVLAAVVAVGGSLAGNVVVSAAFTARALEVSTFEVLRAVTSMTWPVFFKEVMTPADAVYALIAAAVAAFYANKRLDRKEFLAVRKLEQEQGNDRND